MAKQARKNLMIGGLGTASFGGLVVLASRIGLPFGRLPENFVWQHGDYFLYVPVTTMILFCLIALFLLWAFMGNK